MKHKWFSAYFRTPLANSHQLSGVAMTGICIKCGMTKRTTRINNGKYRSLFIRQNITSQNKTPPCDETWPEGWRPCDGQIKYNLVIGNEYAWIDQQWTNKSMKCSTFEEAKKFIKRYGTPTRISSNYEIDGTCKDFLRWMILELDFFPSDFIFSINDIRYDKNDEELNKTFMLVFSLCDYARVSKEEGVL